VAINGEKRIVCNVCGQDGNGEWKATFKLGPKGITSNANTHLRTEHRFSQKKQKIDHNQSTLHQFRVEPFDSNHVLWRKFQQNLIYWIVDDLIPLNKLKKESFRDLWKVVGVSQLPQPRKVQKEMYDLRESIQEDLKSEFADLDSQLALTADSWTSKRQKSYFTITCHYISKDWVPSLPPSCLDSKFSPI